MCVCESVCVSYVCMHVPYFACFPVCLSVCRPASPARPARQWVCRASSMTLWKSGLAEEYWGSVFRPVDLCGYSVIVSEALRCPGAPSAARCGRKA